MNTGPPSAGSAGRAAWLGRMDSEHARIRTERPSVCGGWMLCSSAGIEGVCWYHKQMVTVARLGRSPGR